MLRHITSAIAALMLGLLAFTAAPVTAQSAVENPEGIWTHSATGTHFPRYLGEAERTEITAFDDAGKDVSVSYGFRGENGGLRLTIYEYPAFEGSPCAELYEGAKLSIEQYRGAKLIEESAQPSPDGTRSDAAAFARYTIPEGSMRADYPALVSDLYLYCPATGEWLVKYRASWSGPREDFPDIGALLRQISWSDAVK